MGGLGGRGEQGKSGTACAGSSVSDTGLLSTKPEKMVILVTGGKGDKPKQEYSSQCTLVNLNFSILHF